ncbi:MAG: neutral/alkaline non-lysosomal ceramidase N-terminal domain-containing protein [Bacteroidales bacterium]|nr:neutral/alkaline non-lysosomal ceramidase N-terminal domain-containing protein [Bacteroidales bacterium]
MRLLKQTFLFVFLLMACSCSTPALKCNFTSADISTLEDEHVVLAGFAARNNLSDGIHLKLRTHALAITDGEQKVCIISNDVMEISPSLAGEIRTEISKRSGLDYDKILLHCIHTHSAPRFGGASAQPGGTNAAYKERTVEAIIANAVKAITDEEAYQEFSLEIAKGTTDINRNRCEAAGPVDHALYGAKVVAKDGKPICAFFNLACHPVSMGHISLMLSSDYSGVARREISKDWGCEVFQLSGASGNMNPVGPESTYEQAEIIGGQLYESLKALKFEKVPAQGLLRFSTGVAELPYSIDEVTPEAVKAHADDLVENMKTVFPRFARDVRGWEAEILERFEEGPVKSKLDFNMAAVNVDGVLFFFTQGEPFCEYQMEAREAFPGKTVFFAGYTGGQNSYLPSAHAFATRKGYEYEIEQMHVYIKAPYPLSDKMPEAYKEAVFQTIAAVNDPERYSIIPMPASLEPRHGENVFKGEPKVKYFQDDAVAAEGYILDITPKSIKVTASTDAGRFYAMQTIKQLLPAEVYGPEGFAGKEWSLPCCRIVDEPKFAWRGMQLDCGRYFYSKEEVMKFIDMMAMHKQNMFHWHLTEDQGWRIEIKKYPKLTEVGAWRKETTGYLDSDGKEKEGDNTPHGGFYTQEDIREIVAYAAERHVTVVPEIELPGHSSAAIAAYPWLSCTPDEPKEVVTSWGIKEDVYCPSPKTFEFLEDVFDEVLELFPSPYYHIGGDECPKEAWRASEYCHHLADSLGLSSVDDLQYYFVKHFDSYLRERGKTVIGWDEILDGSAVPSTVVMSYRGHAPASRAFAKDMKVVLAPNRWCYYDYEQEEIEDIFKNHHLFITLRKAYLYDYMQYLNPEVAHKAEDLLLGIQACVWGEYIPDAAKLHIQTFPRSATIAEVAWTPDSSRNWNDFRLRLEKEFDRLEAKGVGCSKAYWQVIVNMNLESEYPREIELELDYPYAVIRYTTDGTEPTAESPLAPRYMTVKKGDTISARGFKADGTPVGTTMTRTF